MRVLRQLDFDFVRARALILEEGNIWDGSTLQLNCRTEYSDIAGEFGDPWAVIHRRDLGRELRRLASCQSSTRRSVKIHYESPVTDIDCEEGVLTMEDGSRIQKNIIIGADGVDSLVAKHIINGRVDTTAYRTTFRFVIPTNKLLQNESTRELFEGKSPALNIAVSRDKRLVWYPCRNANEQNFVALHMTSRDHDNADSKDQADPQKCLLKEFDEFSPKIREIFRLVDNITFKSLSLQKPIKSWTKGKTVIIGNAAHFMLPHQGQCESQGIEDAGALSVFLSRVNSGKDIPGRLMCFQKARWNRTAALQILSSVAQDQAQDEAEKVEEASIYIRGHIPRTPLEFN
ncbi:hypothetical protein N7462_002542, partial [Penicillium macrosclerotiorum]|uniref:uncharacterized protein n=1 Tax=Penicillium macrosclerotiorum TaxID=303699 RepID=UPI0025495AEC